MENFLHHELVRSRYAEELADAEAWRRARRILTARRLNRRAERAALRARLILARTV